MASLDAFRRETRAWLEANCPQSQRQPVVKEEQVWAGKNRTFPSTDAKLWLERMRDRGWTAPEWPREFGGGGLIAAQAQVLKEEMAALNCRPPLYDNGLWMLGPALLKFGNESQKAEHLPSIARGEIRWCQGYSEPEAGSDLAALKTRAEDHGDHFLVNGTKIWTSQAHLADWIFCLVRTDPEAPKQQGISFLLIDMTSDGISTEPIKLISGESEFSQTFLNNVCVPKANLVGELNQGWTVAKELLGHERKHMSTMGSITQYEEQELPMLAKRLVGTRQSGQLRDAIMRDRISSHLMRANADLLTKQRMFEQMEQNKLDPRLPMIMKYVSTTEVQIKDELLLDILGNRGLSWYDETFTPEERAFVKSWAFDKCLTIAGGSSEIQLNIIAKRALKLPG